MNDLVFVMYNLKLKRIHEKQASKFIMKQPIVLDGLPSDDEWISKIEEPVLPASSTWLNALDRASRRFARVVQNGDEGTDAELNEFQYENVEVQMLSDDDEVAATFDSNEIDLDDIGDDAQMGETTTRATTGSDDVDDGNFGYND